MKQSGYLKRQADVQDRLLQIGTEVGQQQVFDALALALRDPAVMGAKGVLGPAKVKTVCQRVQESAGVCGCMVSWPGAGLPAGQA